MHDASTEIEVWKSDLGNDEYLDGNAHKISRYVRCNNIYIYIYRLKKNNHTQDSIYVIFQFIYVHRVVRISLLLGKNTRCDSAVFSHKNNIKP